MGNPAKTVYNSRSVRLKQALLQDVQRGRFGAGTLLPTEGELAALYQVSRSTIGRVVKTLTEENHLSKHPQRGVVVPSVHGGNNRNQVAWITLGLSENMVEFGRGLHDALSPDYTLGTYCSHADIELYLQLVDKVVTMRPDGLVLQFDSLVATSYDSRRLEASGIPTIVIGGENLFKTKCDRVYTSRNLAARKMGHYLIGKNYRDLAFVTVLAPHQQKPMTDELKKVLESAGIVIPDERIFHFKTPHGWAQPPNPYIDAQEQMAKLLADGFRCGTIIVDHDYPAVGVLRALLAAGIRVPEDVQVTSLNKCNVEGVFPLRLTTIDHQRYEVGHTAGEILRRRMAGDVSAPEVYQLVCSDVIVGETG